MTAANAIRMVFQSTLSVRRATFENVDDDCCGQISIHALREESDFLSAQYKTGAETFQSTLSVRRATQHAPCVAVFQDISIHALREESDTVWVRDWGCQDISIHALREESDRPRIKKLVLAVHFISIHALREESDENMACKQIFYYLFQSTLSVRRATLLTILQYFCYRISIHALREESDSPPGAIISHHFNFNPRSP